MIVFIQRTWFVWWILATVIILRWFHLFSYRTDESAFEMPDLGEGERARHRISPEPHDVYLSETENLALES